MKSQMTDMPELIDWQLTYACQLRCIHCYTESGRRASRKLPRAELLRIADILVAMKVKTVLLAGGEPLLVHEVFEIVRKLRAAGIAVSFYTNGLDMKESHARELADLGAQIHVSIDGPTPEVNDPIRGWAGAFAAAVQTLELLDRLALERRRAGQSALRFGIDVTLVQSNSSYLEKMCSEFAHRFQALTFIQMGAVIPSGLAAEAAFARQEVLTDAQMSELGAPGLSARLKALAPPSLEFVYVTNNIFLQLHSPVARDLLMPYGEVMEIEPDGAIRAMVTYEGTVGNILTDSPALLWRRCQERAHHPQVVEELSRVRTSEEWAAAVRRLDRYFGTTADLIRFDKRKPFARRTPAGEPHRHEDDAQAVTEPAS